MQNHQHINQSEKTNNRINKNEVFFLSVNIGFIYIIGIWFVIENRNILHKVEYYLKFN